MVKEKRVQRVFTPPLAYITWNYGTMQSLVINELLKYSYQRVLLLINLMNLYLIGICCTMNHHYWSSFPWCMLCTWELLFLKWTTIFFLYVLNTNRNEPTSWGHRIYGMINALSNTQNQVLYDNKVYANVKYPYYHLTLLE